jgi:cold shock CspA family protein
MKGIIRKLSPNGYGFLRVEGKSDVFFHASGLVDVEFDSLLENQAVTFDMEAVETANPADKKARPKAVNVKLID